jgi:hypothetical protein
LYNLKRLLVILIIVKTNMKALKFNEVNKVTWILLEFIQYLRFMILKYYKLALLNRFLQLLMKNKELKVLFAHLKVK